MSSKYDHKTEKKKFKLNLNFLKLVSTAVKAKTVITMNIKNFKENPTTSIIGIFTALLMLAGVFLPDILTEDVQSGLVELISQVCIAMSALISAITHWFVKEETKPDDDPPSTEHS